MSFLFVSGESYKSFDNIIYKNNDYLIGFAYSEKNYLYLKFKEIEHRNSFDIIALGSSRVLQFRDKMFNCTFYNAGNTISSIADFKPFIESFLIPKKPKIVIITLDQWMFNANWENLANYSGSTKIIKASFTKNASLRTIFKVWSDLLKGKYGFEILSSNSKSLKKIGLNAIVNSKGFRRDGSYDYGNLIFQLLTNDSTANDYGYSDTYSRINNGIRRFEYGSEVNDMSIKALNDLLAFCKKNDIYVVAILPPFADKVNLKMKQSGNYLYMDSIYSKSVPIFEKYNFELWDMTSLSCCESNDNEVIDGFHGSEVTYIRMLKYMVENGSKLKDFTNLEKLKKDIKNRKNNLTLY